MPKLILRFLQFALHFPAIYILYYFWQPISAWYLAKTPALGVDLYLSATYAAYHSKGLNLPFNSFKDFWFAGSPLMKDFPQLVFYFMVPFVNKFGPVEGVRVFTTFALLFIVVSCYLLFYKLSKNHGIAVLFAVLVMLSPTLYGSAIWAGSIPYFVSQAFFPLGLFAGAFYLDKPSLRFLALMILIAGLGLLIHPLSILAFLIPSSMIIIFFSNLFHKSGFKKIILHLSLFNIGCLLAGFIVTNDYVVSTITSLNVPFHIISPGSTGGVTGETAASQGSTDIANFYKSQVRQLWEKTHILIFQSITVALFAYIASFFVARRKSRYFQVLPFILIAGYCALHAYVNVAGVISFWKHDLYRAFWPFTIAVAAVSSYMFGFLFVALEERLGSKFYFLILNFMIILISSVGLIYFTNNTFKREINPFLQTLDRLSEFSSAFPEALSIKTKQEDLKKVTKELIPSFMDPFDRNKRLYVADATVNIWWNTFFDLPLARGYIDPPVGGSSRGGIFWLDIAIANDSLIRDFKASEEVALNNALFLIDWNAISYFEGGRESSKGPSVPPSSYLLKNNVFEKDEMVQTHGAVLKYQTASGKPELVDSIPQYLHFFKVAEKNTTTILYPTDTAAMLFFGTDSAYDDAQRVIASQNINSKKLVLVKLAERVNAGDYIDTLTLKDLKLFDGVIMNEYVYKNRDKAFGLLEKYVKEGGKVFIDTGGEVKEAESGNLPAIIPFNNSERKGLGKEWQINGSSAPVLQGIDTSKFGPLIYQEDEWKLSTPRDGKLRGGANVILSHMGKPVLVEMTLGQGKVYWSGFNLFYHYNQYKSQDEANLFINILKELASFDERQPGNAKVQWISNEKVLLETSQKPRGIMFKEEGYSGWKAKINGESRRIYLAGPTFPGFMYVPVGNVSSSQVKAEFTYSGKTSYLIATLINLGVILILLDMIIFNNLILSHSNRLVFSKVRNKLGRWWAKEEENV